MSAISSWAKEDRPRERLVDKGAQSLSETDLLAILLRSGSHTNSALDLARQIQDYTVCNGGWDRVGAQELSRIPGVGLAKAATLMAAVEWSKRLRAAKILKPKILKGSSQAWYFCREKLIEKSKERACHREGKMFKCRHQLSVSRLSVRLVGAWVLEATGWPLEKKFVSF